MALEAARSAGTALWWVSVEQLPAEQSVAAAVLDVVAPSSRAVDARQGVADVLSGSDGLLVLDACEGRVRGGRGRGGGPAHDLPCAPSSRDQPRTAGVARRGAGPHRPAARGGRPGAAR